LADALWGYKDRDLKGPVAHVIQPAFWAGRIGVVPLNDCSVWGLTDNDRVIDDRGYLIDRVTQSWVRATGTKISLDEHPWLVGPIGGTRRIADDWLAAEAERLGGSLAEGGGLLAGLDQLAGNGFDPSFLSPQIANFYQRTADWRLEVWSQWCPVAWPFGWLISALFSQRLQQLSLPLRPLDAALGMDSRVVTVKSFDGTHMGAGWLRMLRSTGQNMYSGWYGVEQLPNTDRASVRVVFPLPNGSVSVFLRPEVRTDGALILTSPVGRFGDDGAYLIVVGRDGQSAHVRRVPLAEKFVVWVDDEGVLRTDHSLALWQVPVLRLHYRHQPKLSP